MLRDRFAPSPNGHLHLGHAYSALFAWDSVRRANGEFILRIEDIDTARSRPEFEAAILQDMAWLGIEWNSPVMRQSARMDAYENALAQLAEIGVCYPCNCTRADIRNALSAPQETGHPANGSSAKQPPYPGTCRSRSMQSRTHLDAVRLNMGKAISVLGGKNVINRIWFDDTGEIHEGRHQLSANTLLNSHGDIVIARKDIRTSYHLAVVVDDAEQKVTQVTRGADLFGATEIHRLLQELLGLPVPVWHHHRLIRDGDGKRMAKRRESRSIRSFREEGGSPEELRRLIGLSSVSGVSPGQGEPASARFNIREET